MKYPHLLGAINKSSDNPLKFRKKKPNAFIKVQVRAKTTFVFSKKKIVNMLLH